MFNDIGYNVGMYKNRYLVLYDWGVILNIIWVCNVIKIVLLCSIIYNLIFIEWFLLNVDILMY